MATRKKTPNFEQNLEELETLVTALESGGMSLEDSLKAFENGVRITRECQDALKDAELKVKVLSQNTQGEIVESPLDDEDLA